METLQERQKEIVKEFSGINNWEDRYLKIIQMGKELPGLPEELKTSEALVKGCQSQVWMHPSLNDNNHLEIKADSDAMIVRGLIALLLRVYSDAPLDEVMTTPPDFITELGFQNNLSPSRANGLNAMIKQIKFFALAYKSR